jgi:hypothetical protein
VRAVSDEDEHLLCASLRGELRQRMCARVHVGWENEDAGCKSFPLVTKNEGQGGRKLSKIVGHASRSGD